MRAETLLDVAEANYKVAKGLQRYKQDPVNIGYHLQQAIEFAIKHFLAKEGIESRYAHGVIQLMAIAERNHIDIPISEYIDKHWEMFISWYAKESKLTPEQIETAMAEVGKYLDVCRKAYEQELGQTGKDEPDEQDEALSEEPAEEMEEKDEI